MIVCPSCQHHNDPHASVCAKCGVSLSSSLYRACPVCGALNEAQHLYCSRCLSDLIPVEQSAAAESADSSAPDLLTAEQSALPADAQEGAPTLIAPPPADVLATGEPQPDAGQDDAAPALVDDENLKELESSAVEATIQDDELAWLRMPVDEPPSATELPAPSAVERQGRERDDQPNTGVVEPALPDDTETDATEPLAALAEAPDDEGAADGQVVGSALEPSQITTVEPTKPQILAPLEDLGQSIPIETAVALPHRAEARPPRAPEEVERRDATLFQQIATEPASLAVPAHVLLPTKGQALPRWGQVLLNLLVLAAVLLPYFTGGLSRYWVTPRPAVMASADMLNSLPDGSQVLIAFDYTPTYAGEIDPLAMAVLRQLVRQSVKIVALSTQPGGVGIAEKTLRQAAQEVSDYTLGQDYVVLGYLAAQEAGLRALSNPLTTAFKVDQLQPGQKESQLAVMSGILTLDDFDHVIVFAENAQDVRQWIEQVHSRHESMLHAFVSSRIAPLLMPYKQSGQLTTLLGAADSVAEYEIASGVRKSSLGQTDAHAALIMLMILLAVVANVIYVSRGSRRADQGPAD